MTPKGTLSEKRHDYRNELLAERFLGYPQERFRRSEWMQCGIDMEDEAVEHFIANQRDLYGRAMELEKIGFVTTSDGRLGCSPDRVVKTDSRNLSREAVEIKCPAAWTHIGYLIDGLGDDYVPQVQGQMLVGEFDVIHFYSYHPDFPPYYQMTERRKGFIDVLQIRLGNFLWELDSAEQMLRKLKGWPTSAEP